MSEDSNPRAVLGGNSPPLAETLPVDTAELSARLEALLGGYGRAVFNTEDDIKKALVLAGQIKRHVDDIDAARVEKGAPYLAATRAINAHYNALTVKLAVKDPKGKLIGGPLFELTNKIDKFRRDQEAAAEAERRRLEAEAAKARAEAERLAAPPPAAPQGFGKPVAPPVDTAAAENAIADAQELERQAEAIQTKSAIDTGVGVKAGGRQVTVVRIDDIKKAAAHCLKVALPEMKAVIQTVYERLARARVQTLPGATITQETRTIIRGG